MTDRIPPAALRLSLAGVTLEVLAEEPALAPLRQRFAAHRCHGHGGNAERLDVVRTQGGCTLHTRYGVAPMTLDGRWPTLVTVVQAMVMAQRPELVFLHAASVSGPGGALLLVGPSTAGKSTLAAGLVRRGYARLADDCAPVDLARRTVLPFLTSPGRIGETNAEARVRTQPAALCHCCFLVPQGGRGVPASVVDDAAARWAALRPLFPKSVAWTAGRETLYLRGTRDFSAPPALARCPLAEALPLFMRHVQSPPLPLGETLQHLQTLARQAHFHVLRCGQLEPSLDLLDGLLLERAPCP